MKGLIVSILLLLSGSGSAMGVGHLQVYSFLNQPLVVDIPLSDIEPAVFAAASVSLAAEEDFEKAGLPFRSFYNELRFKKIVDEQGKAIIRVTSIHPIEEPVLSFLVKFNTKNMTIIKECNVLLDPPDISLISKPVPVYTHRAPINKVKTVIKKHAATAVAPKVNNPLILEGDAGLLKINDNEINPGFSIQRNRVVCNDCLVNSLLLQYSVLPLWVYLPSSQGEKGSSALEKDEAMLQQHFEQAAANRHKINQGEAVAANQITKRQ